MGLINTKPAGKANEKLRSIDERLDAIEKKIDLLLSKKEKQKKEKLG